MGYQIVRRLCGNALSKLAVPRVGGVAVLHFRAGPDKLPLPGHSLFMPDGNFNESARRAVNLSHRSWLKPASDSGKFLVDSYRMQAACLVGSANLAQEQQRAKSGRKPYITSTWKDAVLGPLARHVGDVFFGGANQMAEHCGAMLLITLVHQPKAFMLREFLLGAMQSDVSLQRVNARLAPPDDLVAIVREVFVDAAVESFCFQREERDVQDDREPLQACLGEAAAV